MANNENLEPKAENGLDKMKYEIAQDEGINLKKGYNGDITAKEAGKIGGNIVKRMIEFAERRLKD